MTRVWILHLDADREYAVGRGYSPPRGDWSDASRWLQAPELQAYFQPQDLVLLPQPDRPQAPLLRAFRIHPGAELEELALARGKTPSWIDPSASVLYWSPTPRTLRMTQELGLSPPEVPAFEVLQEVNRRSFGRALGIGVSGGSWISSAEDWRAFLTSDPLPGPWLLKPEFGASGRGQFRVRVPEEVSKLEPRLQAAWGRGETLRLEPHLLVDQEVSVAAWVSPQGELRLGAVCEQRVDPRGQWLGSQRLEANQVARAEAFLLPWASTVAEALTQAGYFGPFGLDAIWAGPVGQPRTWNLLEVNARASMGWAVSMRAQGLDPGEIMLAGNPGAC